MRSAFSTSWEVLQYFLRSTPVLPREYSGTSKRVLALSERAVKSIRKSIQRKKVINEMYANNMSLTTFRGKSLLI